MVGLRASASSGSIRRVERTAGQGGQIVYRVDIDTADGRTIQLSLAGNIFGGPVAVSGLDENGNPYDTVISESREFGEFAAESWIHEVFAAWRHGAPAQEPTG